MCKYLLLLCFLFNAISATGQTDSLTNEDKRLLDSMFKNDEFIKMIIGKKDKSYFEVHVVAGNQSISTTNNNANVGELESHFTLTPGVNYHHKSGFGLAASAFLAVDSGKLKSYQYSIDPYFEYYGKSFNAGVYYTRYIFNEASGFSPNPFKNAFYGNLSYIKTYLAPGLSVGYNTGRFTDSLPVIRRKLEIRVSDFSLSAYVLHKYSFYELLSKNDGLIFTPTIMLVAGKQKAKAPGLNNPRLSNLPRLKKYLKNRYESDSKFQVQSIAASVNLNYQYKKFFIEPNLYCDYYLPATTYKRFTTVFSITTGFLF